MTTVTTEDRGAVRHIVLDRPEKRNAMNGELVQAVGVALKQAANDGAVRIVVIRGAGAMFSAGMDVAELGRLSEMQEHLRAFRRECIDAWNLAEEMPIRRECIDAWNLAEEMPKPTIAQIHGGAIGGAMELALACDLRVMADDAVMCLPETRIGLIPDVGGSSRLPAIVGLGRAKEMIMTSKVVGAEEAERIGLANRVAPAGELDAAVERLCAELLACAPTAVGLAKRVMDASARPALAATLEQEVTAQQVCAASEDFAEGARALSEKRQPEFSGS